MAQMARREVLAVVAALLGVAWELPGAGAFAPGAAGPALLGGNARRSLHLRPPLRMAAPRPRGHGAARPASSSGRHGSEATRLAQADAGASSAGGGGGDPRESSSLLGALYKFTRPHTIRGTILASCACVTRVMLKCIQTQPVIEWRLLQTAFYGLVALLCGNAYIVGINQVCACFRACVRPPTAQRRDGACAPWARGCARARSRGPDPCLRSWATR